MVRKVIPSRTGWSPDPGNRVHAYQRDDVKPLLDMPVLSARRV